MRSNVLAAAALAAVSIFMLPMSHAVAAEYHWAPTGPPSWPAPGSWSPARITPLASDRLVFDGGGAATVNSVPTANIGQLVVANGTQVTLNSGASGNTLTIGGDTGPDLEIASGTSLILATANALSVNLGSGATAAIAGNVTAVGGAHRLQSLDVDAIVFAAGSFATASTNFTGNLFGTGTVASGFNSVRFQAGSTYVQLAGANPFGAGQPFSVVTFDHGSLYRLDASIVPSMSGRTYGNFEYNGPGAVTGAGSAASSIDDVVVNSGTLSLELTGTLNLRGSIRVRPGALLNLGPLSGTTNYRLNGSSMQALVDSTAGSLPGIVLRPSVQLSLDNPAGFTDSGSGKRFTVPGILEFVHGVAHILTLGLSTTGSCIGASQATGWLDGVVNPYPVTAASPNVTLPLGTATTYMPVDLSLHGMTHANRLAGVLYDGLSSNPDYYAGVQLDTTRLVFPSYLVAVLDSTGWSDFDAVMHFAPAEYAAGANPLAFVARRQSFSFVVSDVAWRPTTLGARTATSLQVLGATRFHTSDTNFNFAIGEPSIVRVSVLDSAAVEAGGPLRMRIVLSEPSVDPISFDIHTTSGSATEGVDYQQVATRIAIAPGTTQFIVSVPMIADATPEPDETFTLTLSGPDHCVIDRAIATATILDNDDSQSPTVTVVAPNGGESKLPGDSVSLDWTASDDTGVASIDLALSRDDGGTWEPIASGLANTGSYAWIATGPITQLARLRATATDVHGNVSVDVSDAAWAIWSVDGVEPALPATFALSFASANPGSGTSRIRYALPRDQDVQLSVVDVRGRVVAVLANGPEAAGVHVGTWESRDASAGVYFVRFRTQDWKSQLRLVHLR